MSIRLFVVLTFLCCSVFAHAKSASHEGTNKIKKVVTDKRPKVKKAIKKTWNKGKKKFKKYSEFSD